MKLSIVAIILIGVLSSSCGFYTCATYVKKVEPSNDIEIESECI